MKLKVTLIVQPEKDSSPKLSQEVVIDTSVGMFAIGSQLTILFTSIWNEVRAREAEFERSVKRG